MPTSLDLVESQLENQRLLEALGSPAMYPAHPEIHVHETHASWVFVAGERTYKVKKPVALGFLDYSSLARRRAACREEVRVNQDLAPDLYLGVRAIVSDGDGFRLAPDGALGALEYAVEMRTFREADTFAGLIAAHSLKPRHLVAAARRLAAFHSAAPAVSDWGTERIRAFWHANVRELSQPRHPPEWAVSALHGFGDAFVERHADEIRRRALLGFARDGHGDLRCEHVLARPAVRVVDRIEFDPQLRRVDVACDVAFLTMDLEAHGERAAARELIRAYRDAGMSLGGEQLRAFFASHWALVRTKVALIASSEQHREAAREEQLRCAHQLWSLAERLRWRARSPVALVICGPAASGKSSLAAELSRRSELPVLASDLVRKRLAGVPAHARARAEHYSEAFTHETYAELGREAFRAVRRRGGAIVDATCRARREREALLACLRESGATCLTVRCEVSLQAALERSAKRLRDPRRASDATPEIVRAQWRAFEQLEEQPAASVLRVDTARGLSDQVIAVEEAVDRVLPGGGAASGS